MLDETTHSPAPGTGTARTWSVKLCARVAEGCEDSRHSNDALKRSTWGGFFGRPRQML